MTKPAPIDVEEFIRKHGVTKCPPGIAAPSTATITPETAQAHRERGTDPAGDAYRTKAKKKGAGWSRYWQSEKGKRRRLKAGGD